MRSESKLIWSLVASMLLSLWLANLPLPYLPPIPWLLLTVIFWSLYRPSIAGIGMAWLVGVLMDVSSATPLGTHALIFTVVSALTLAARRLLLAFSLIQQALWVGLMVALNWAVLSLLSLQHAPTPQSIGLSTLLSVLVWIGIHLMLRRPIQSMVR